MKQRLGIAAALLGDAPVLLFDEPVNGLDPEGIHWIRGLLRGLAGQGRAVFVSSHLMSELEDTADHLIVVARGRLVADISIAGLLARAPGDRGRAAHHADGRSDGRPHRRRRHGRADRSRDAHRHRPPR
ncbi:AAA family ATPase [Actinoplanes sp. NPDC051470]|uniref:AAA family ATPase n=1 Tax=Actinoplanes sp. NPDC051470 TaxID=3157224 RepID=UPI00344A8429